MEINEKLYLIDTQRESISLIKISGRILSQLKELEAKLELQEELLLDLRKNQIVQESPKTFEPIRGIHGLAEFLGVSPVTAQKLKNSGKIPFVQFDRLLLFDPQKVLAALEFNNKSIKK